MDLAYGGRRDVVAPHKQGAHPHRTGTVHAFWVVLGGGSWVLPLTVFSADGKEAVALFSGEEEARMFCRLREPWDEWAISTIRRTTAGGVLSMLYCPRLVRHVALDPLPGFLGERHSGQMALSRARFARRFSGAEPRAVGR
jgi:hypothetical protein